MATATVNVRPALLAWARLRSGIDYVKLVKQFPQLARWEAGESAPTIRQLENFASYTHTPVGYLFLDVPPAETLPVPDFRTRSDGEMEQASADLLETIYICQLRQQWFSDHAIREGYEQCSFVGSLTADLEPSAAAQTINETLQFTLESRRAYRTWSEAFSGLTAKAEAMGCLVMTSGIVGSNTHRKLDPDEFRGFSLVDSYAPLIFINGADTRAATIFTLIHELAHLWLGQSGVDNPMPSANDSAIERWCNSVAAEILVPGESVDMQYRPEADVLEEIDRLARLYKVSSLVVLSRLHDRQHLTWDEYRTAWNEEKDRLIEQIALAGSSDGGNFYNTLPVRVSKRFARALVSSAMDGQTPYSEAVGLLGFKSMSTFDTLSRELGVSG